MRKMLVIMLLVSVVMMLSVGVSADFGPLFTQKTGIFENFDASMFSGYWFATTDSGSQYNIMSFSRGNQPSPANWGDQTATIIVGADAFIPCYLELELRGNWGYSKIKTMGPDIEENPAEVQFGNYPNVMRFHPNIGGLMDGSWAFVDWQALEGQEFSTVGPDRGLFIHACDLFQAKVYGNVAYNFIVEADPFVGNHTTDTFYLDMRVAPEGTTALDDPDAQYFTEVGDALVASLAAKEHGTYLMQFRIPWSDVDAGKYTSTVYFIVSTP